MASDATLIMGAVAYAPKVVTIWDGFKDFFVKQGLVFDYVLYSNYERQVEAMFSGAIHVAWNSPLAWVRAERLARARGVPIEAIVMRDSDCDLTSVIVVRSDSNINSLADLKGKKVAVGALDSPQATLIPLDYLRGQGLKPGVDFTVRRFDVLGGKHGDHIGGERDAARALIDGLVDAACMIDSNHLLFINEGTLPAAKTRVLAQTPAFDHCNFTVSPNAPAGAIQRFKALLLGMSYADPEVRPLFDLEGLKAWKPGRTNGYQLLQGAVDATGFYDTSGNITVADYRY
ncbi:MAG: phosphate/phosphite/phosphonate ABC transporter substrate-binding protein [Pseudomonadota bacterium]|nr:phosphate/phosphite/phosphonate ABC transporter substrate-binding protein [Pseudomonadota bacterium]